LGAVDLEALARAGDVTDGHNIPLCPLWNEDLGATARLGRRSAGGARPSLEVEGVFAHVVWQGTGVDRVSAMPLRHGNAYGSSPKRRSGCCGDRPRVRVVVECRISADVGVHERG